MPGDLSTSEHDEPLSLLSEVGGDLRRATPAEAARTIAATGRLASLSTLTDRPAGHPFGSLVSYALDGDGHPLVVISTMAEHTRNARRDPRASLLAAEDANPREPLDAGRVTLLGSLRPLEASEQEAAVAAVVDAVPSVAGYAHFADFSCWRLTVEEVRWVGGFGTMGWVDAAAYRAATPDPVLAARRAVVGHMNDDHGDACRAIASAALGGAGVTAATMVGVDRYGCDYVVSSAAGGVRLRVPFSEPAVGVADVRRHLVAQAGQARLEPVGGAVPPG